MTKEEKEFVLMCLYLDEHENDLVRRLIHIYAEGSEEAKAIMNRIDLKGLTLAQYEEAIQRAESAM